MTLNQNARISVGFLEPAQTLQYGISRDTHAWLQMARGEITLNGYDLAAGDGAAIEVEPELAIQAGSPSELLLFDLA